jgi:hypothetical protein
LEVLRRRSLSVRRKLSVNHCAKKQNSAVVRVERIGAPRRMKSSATRSTSGNRAPCSTGAGGRWRPV